MKIKKSRSNKKKSEYPPIEWIFGSVLFTAFYGITLLGLYGYVQTHQKSEILKAQRDIFRAIPDPNAQTYNEYKGRIIGILVLILGYLLFSLLILAGVYCAIRSDDRNCQIFPVAKAIFWLVVPSILAFLVLLHMLRLKNKDDDDVYFKAWFLLLSVLIIPLVCFGAGVFVLVMYIIRHSSF